MNSMLNNYFVSFKLGEGVRHRNMVVFPIAAPLDEGLEYRTLKEALELGVLAVTEVSEGGSVPNLKVSNKGEIPVILLDGEELAGAKQNRVLNTTILVAAGAETVIPVSCTEQGRWSYLSREFYASGNVMSPGLRAMKNRSVAASLECSREFRSDQGRVWCEIDAMAMRAGAESATGAMRDVYESKMADLDAYLKAFKRDKKQKGLLAMIDGKVVGFDFVSREKAFATLFPKLVKSYAMEAWLEEKKMGGETRVERRADGGLIPGLKAEKKGASKGRKSAEGDAETDLKKTAAKDDAGNARAFLKAAAACDAKSYDSVGLGTDVRFDGKGIVGSALVVNDKPVHVAFFSAADSDKAGFMAGPGSRRGFRL